MIYHWEFARDGQEVAVAFVSLILADTTIAIGLHRLSMPR